MGFFNFPVLAAAVHVLAVLIYFVYPYLSNEPLRRIPGPFVARFTNVWLFLQARRGRRYVAVNDAHRRFGPVVRIAPNHVSIVDPDAVNMIYGHGNGFTKSDFYDAFVSLRPGLFSTRSRTEHTRKRKVVSHLFSAKSTLEFEPFVKATIETLLRQWDRLSRGAGGSYAPIDALDWCNWVAFDCIGDLAFGAPFGMTRNGTSTAKFRDARNPLAPITTANAVEALEKRGYLTCSLGCMIKLKSWAKWIPDPVFQQGLYAMNTVNGIGAARVDERIAKPSQRTDLLTKLMEARDETGKPLSREELISEALTQVVAGADTTSNSLCPIIFYIARDADVQKKLHTELDLELGDLDGVPEYSQIKNLPYLWNVVKEGLRLHTTSALGLAREIPPGSSCTVQGHHFPERTILSIPSWTMHHDTNIWGPDAMEYRPERFDCLTTEQKKAFNPFSFGPRACSGRNLAEMETLLVVATIFKRYSFECYQEKLVTTEGFLHKPLGCSLGIRRR